MEERLRHLEDRFAAALSGGRTAEARLVLDRADWARTGADAVGRARVEIMTARLLRAEGRPAEAARAAERAVAAAREGGRHDLVASGWLVELADARLAAGDGAGSERALAESDALLATLTSPAADRTRLRAALVRARAKVAAGDHDAAADLLARAAAALREASPALAAEALAARSAVLRSGGRPEDAAAAGAGSRALRVTPPPAAAPPPATDPDAPPPAVDEAMLAAAMADLDALVGLAPVKEEIRRLVAYSRVQRRRAEAGRKVPALAHHLLFLGPPGTGKTTVARLLGRLYRAVGVLRSGHLVETDRSGLVAGFVGQTAPKVNEACDRALDGVLFIDEAYALVRPGAQSDFGEEALAALLKRMEDDRMRLLVVLAGYEGPMREMLDANPGLASRIPNHVEFHSYTADELAEILRRMARADDYRLDAEADSALREIAGALAAHAAEPDFGNARTMRNLYEEALMRHAERVADDPAADLNALVAADLRDAAEALPE